MYYHLCNQRDPTLTLTLTHAAWHQMLELALNNGWNPMGTLHPNLLLGLSAQFDEDLFGGEQDDGTYTPQARRLVMLDDALNLMDALERAFLAFEPQRVSAYSQFYRKPQDALRERARPGIGTLLELAEFCRGGAFWIEKRTATI